MYRVSDILNPEFARSWHEAVAIVQEITSQLAPGATIPGPEDLLIDETGNLQLGFGPDEPQNQVQVLATLLKSLLNGVDAPGGLRDLGNDNAKANPAISSLVAFEQALAFYERPGRANELRAIAVRLQAFSATPAEPEQDPEAEFARLREKVAAKAEADEAGDAGKPARRFSRRTIVIAAAVELAILGAIVVYARPHYFSQASDLSGRVEQKLAESISTGINKLGSVDGPANSTATIVAETPSRATADPPKKSRPAPATQGLATGRVEEKDIARTPILVPTGQVPLTTGGVATGPAFSMAPSGSPRTVTGPRAEPMSQAVVNQTFTTNDREVDPPRITRQQLPRQPEPGDDTGYFDVIITETGEVERVQLVSPMRRFQERMLMAAAKAWRFTPALRDGQPVRYRMRIAIILSDKP